MTWLVPGVSSHLFPPFPRSKSLEQASSDCSLLRRGSHWVSTPPTHPPTTIQRDLCGGESSDGKEMYKSVTHVQIVNFLKSLLLSPSSLLKLPNNKPLPGSKNPHFQNEAKFTAFLVKKSFICMRMKNHFHIKGCALNFILIPRPKRTRPDMAHSHTRGKTIIECFHMTSRRPYWCPKTMKRRPCWCPKPVLWELNSFLMQTLSFVPRNLHRCWPREWKHSIEQIVKGGGSYQKHFLRIFENFILVGFA